MTEGMGRVIPWTSCIWNSPPGKHHNFLWAIELDTKVTFSRRDARSEAFKLRGQDEEKTRVLAGSASKAGHEDEGEKGDDA